MKFLKQKPLSVFFLLFLVLISAVFPGISHAALSTCSATVNPGTTTPNTTTSYYLTINNTNSSPVVFIKFVRPSENFNITGYSANGWNGSVGNTEGTLTGGSIGSNSSFELRVDARSGGTDTGAADWSIQVSDAADGLGMISCTGSLGVAISGSTPDTSPPSIVGDITISEVGSSSVKLSWTTDENSTSTVDFGLTEDFGLTSTDSTPQTNHQMTLTGLTANSTYFLSIKSTDALGNSSQADAGSFVTASAGVTTAPQQSATVSQTSTVTKVITNTPTPTPVIDKTPPSVYLNTDFSKPFTEAPKITGIASDANGVSSVYYSVDGGGNWLPAEKSGSGSFSFTPLGLEDGNYKIMVRAVDSRGNTGYSRTYELVVDRLSPRIGPVLYSTGSQIINPDSGGRIIILPGMNLQIAMSAVGGPVKMILKNEGQSEYEMLKNNDNGLWFANIKFDKSGVYTSKLFAVDGANNKTDKNLNSITVLEPGKALYKNTSIGNATVTVYEKDAFSGLFSKWDGSPYGIKNPFKTGTNGEYLSYLPPGTYYIRVKAPGFKSLSTDIFTVNKNTPVNTDFKLEKARTIQLGPFTVNLPDFGQTYQRLKFITDAQKPAGKKYAVIGKELPFFSFESGGKTVTGFDLRGKKTLITFLPTWSPMSATQLLILNTLSVNREINVLAVVPQEKNSKVEVFRKKAGYDFNIIADPDGEFYEKLGLNGNVNHVIVDNKGIVKRITGGVLGENELLNNLLD